MIAKLNATLKTVRADLAAAAPNKDDVSKDVAMMKEAVGAKPDEGLLWLTYGDTLMAQGTAPGRCGQEGRQVCQQR